MSGHPRVLGPHVIRPSPLAQVSLSRPLSLVSDAPEYTRDPDFWKRFSIAVQANLNSMEADPSSASNNGSGTYSHKKKNPDEWLSQQYKEKQHCRRMAMCITGIVIIIVTAAAVLGWYFTIERQRLADRRTE